MMRHIRAKHPEDPHRGIGGTAALLLAAMGLWFTGSAPVAAQTAGGTITGTVVDPSGAAVNGAQVEVVDARIPGGVTAEELRRFLADLIARLTRLAYPG